jgi:hypothetical protein
MIYVLIFIYLYICIIVDFTNIHMFTLHTNKPLFSLCLQVFETCRQEKEREVSKRRSRPWLSLWDFRVVRRRHVLLALLLALDHGGRMPSHDDSVALLLALP